MEKSRMFKNLTHEEFLERLWKVKSNKEFEVIEKYINQQTPIMFKHLLCNNLFKATPNNMTKKDYGGCPICGHKKRVATKLKDGGVNIDEFERRVKEKYPDGLYKLKKNQIYKNNKEKLILICSKCNNEFGISPVNFYKGRGCPICNRVSSIFNSKGVNRIYNWLIDNNISFEREKSLPNLKLTKPLFFDFFINLNNKKVAIEYDGEQHFFGMNSNKDTLEKTRLRDNEKDIFSKKNNIFLLRISYKEFNEIEIILENFFSQFKVQRPVERRTLQADGSPKKRKA
jgi:rubrerythrin